MPSSAVKLTKRVVDNAAPRTARYVIWDAEIKGFGLRVSERGTKTYILRYRPKGVGPAAPRRFVVLGRHGVLTPDQARAQARTVLGAVAGGKDPALTRKLHSTTVERLVDLFITQHVNPKRKRSTSEGYAALLNKYLLPRFGRRSAESISRSDVSNLHLSLKDRPYQANRLVAVIASMYAFAGRQGLVGNGNNPARDIVRFREHSRDRYLGVGELRRLGESLHLAETVGLPWKEPEKPDSKHLVSEENRKTILPPEVVLAFRLLLFTGARLGEILTLEWQHVDMGRGLIFLPDSKTGRKTIVLSTPALELLRNAQRAGRYVIPGANETGHRSDLKKPWDAIQRHAQLEGVRIHDLRHTFASIGAGASLGLPIVGKLLGHTQPATTARYAHLDSDPLRRASNIIGEKIATALAP